MSGDGLLEPVKSRARRSRWRTAALVVATATAGALVVVELVLQVVTGNLGMPRYDIHPADGRCVGLSPSTAVAYTGWLLRVPEAIHDVNRLGYRGEARERDRPTDVFRVLMVGDSYTYGQAVASDQTMAAHLEGLLHEKTGRRVEVLNFGVPGLNLEENVDQYRKFASQWQHDLVLLLAADNDLGPPICDLVSHRFTAWLIKRVRIARLLYFIFVITPAEDAARAREPEARFHNSVNAFTETSRTAGARFGLVLVHGKFSGANTIRFDSIDPSVPSLLLQGTGSGYADLPFMPNEAHFTPEGNAEAARRIAQWLSTSGLFKTP